MIIKAYASGGSGNARSSPQSSTFVDRGRLDGRSRAEVRAEARQRISALNEQRRQRLNGINTNTLSGYYRAQAIRRGF